MESSTLIMIRAGFKSLPRTGFPTPAGCCMLFVICWLLTFSSIVQAQQTPIEDEDSRGIPRIYKLDARTIGMGDATIADPAYLTSMNINPAGLSFVRNLRNVQVNLFHNWNNNLAWETVTFPVLAYQNHTIAAQIGYHHPGMDAINLLTKNPENQPELNIYQIDVAYALSLYDVVSFGILNNVSFGHNKHSQYWSSYITLGILYAPSQSISYGAAFRGIGHSTSYSIVPDGRTGLGIQKLKESLELGATLHFPIDTDRTWMSLSMANEKRFGEKGIWYKGGLELYATPYLALRSGILFHLKDRDDDGGNIFAPRFGFGFRSDFFRIDYAFSTSDQLAERFHQLGITFEF